MAVATSRSRPGMPVFVMAAFINQMPSAADTAVASSRLAGETRLVRSSISPARNAGRPHSSNSAPKVQSGRFDKAATPTQHTSPANIPVPPMRGTGVAWNFCGPARSVSAER